VSVKEEDNEEELNVEELSAGGDELVQPNNDGCSYQFLRRPTILHCYSFLSDDWKSTGELSAAVHCQLGPTTE